MRTVLHALLPALVTGILAGALACASAAPAGAQSRMPQERMPQERMGQQRLATNRMTCADAKALVKQDGDVTVGTGSSNAERLVADRSYCELTEIAELRFVPTRDNPQCPVGYRCKAPDFEDWNWK